MNELVKHVFASYQLMFKAINLDT